MKYRIVLKEGIINLMINMTDENITQEFIFKHEAKKYFTEEIKQNELIS